MNRHTCLMLFLLLSITAAVLLGCDSPGRGRPPKADAVSVLIPTKGNTAAGVVTFSRAKGGVRVVAEVTGLSTGAHAIHIHEFGDCRSSDGSSAGEHFNPDNQPHGAPDAQERHVGDLGNLQADKNGAASLDIIDPLLALEGEHSIIGRSVVVHAQEDDFTTQPHGAAGGRLACGTIGLARQ